LPKCFLSRNRLHAPGTDFVTATQSFFGPRLMQGRIVNRIETFGKTFGQLRAGACGQGQGFP
jgi:hypothetical protein